MVYVRSQLEHNTVVWSPHLRYYSRGYWTCPKTVYQAATRTYA